MSVETTKTSRPIQVSRLKTSLLSYWAGRQGPAWPLIVGILVMAVYLLLLPFVARTWRATGDEPHYLLAAHSLVTDLDFDLANNYEQLDYLAFYFSSQIEPQIRTTPAGRQILNHYLGLPVLIAPAYALAGRPGVLAFQVVLGGLLAAFTFRLALFISRDEKASLLATFFVALSPPLLMYHYLVYPELIGALLTTWVLYYALTRDRPAPGVIAVVTLSLLLLPWLNRRFVPLAILLALFPVWSWRRVRQTSVDSTPRPVGASLQTLSLFLPLITTILSIGLLFWFNSRLDAPSRADFTIPVESSALWLRLGRGIGWLLDQQRGLFIFAPVYILALWGGPILIQASFRRQDRRWFVLVPFLLSLGLTAAAGGYWVPWELGPRFLVVGLPALASLLALVWRDYARRTVWTAGLVLILVALSLVNSLVIIRNPELPYKSSLPLFYTEKSGLPLTEFLPDLAGYARISPAATGPAAGQVTTEAGRPVWFAEAGRPLDLAQSGPLHSLPFGHYRLTWPVRVDPGLSPDTEVIRISIKFLGGGQLLHRIISAADLPPDGRYGPVRFSLTNPNPDRWRTPMVFHAVSTGHSNVWGKEIIFRPDPFYAWFLPYLYLTLLGGGALLSWYRRRSSLQTALPEPDLTVRPAWPKVATWLLLLALLGGSFGYLLSQQNLPGRIYQAGPLFHFVGRAVADPAATDGQAWLVDPMTDPPQKATYGPFDFYDEGRYHVTFRLKLTGPTQPEGELARLRVSGPANGEPLFTQPLRDSHFSRPDLYHDFVLVFDNPRRQALSFEVDYLGVAALAIDEIRIIRVEK